MVVSLVNIYCSTLAPLCNSCADVGNYLRSDFRFVLFAFLLHPLSPLPTLCPPSAVVLIPDSTAVSLAPVCRVVVPLVLLLVVVVVAAAVAVTRALAAVVWYSYLWGLPDFLGFLSFR